MTEKPDYRCFLQNDPRYNECEAWAEDLFPNAQYRYFREAGCLVCALAFMLRYYEIEKEQDTDIFNPLILCERLIRQDAFSPAADLEIAAISRLYPIGYLGAIKYSRQALEECVRQGYPCLLTVRGTRDVVHFIVPEELTEEDAIVFDPKEGRRRLSEYAAVYQIRKFRKTEQIKSSKDYVLGYRGNCISNIKTGRIAIGFDDGPSEEITERVLDILAANSVKATFFMLGEFVRKYEAAACRIVSDGHQAGVHGWEHLYLNAMSEEERRSSLGRTAEEIRRVCKVTPAVMRPPGGYVDDAVLKTVKELGLSVIGWTVDPGDWWYERSSEAIVESILNRVSAGDIIIMHDVYSVTADALEIVLPKLLQKGLVPVTIDELANECGGMTPGRIYNCF